MGKCKYCGLEAGFLKSNHQECIDKYQKGKLEIIQETEKAIIEASGFTDFDNKVRKIAGDSFIKTDELASTIINGFDIAVDRILDDGLLTLDEEAKILKFKNYYNYDLAVINRNGSLYRIIKSSILRDILEGKVPEPRIDFRGNLSINLEKNETIIWLFGNSQCYEQRTRTHYEGGSHGVSVRIAKGLYYRTSGFKGYPVKTTEMQYISNGMTCLTNKNIYFSSSAKSFKMPYKKILTIEPYSDGIGLQKDTSTAKPIILKDIDGWFVYNVVSNLSKM